MRPTRLRSVVIVGILALVQVAPLSASAAEPTIVTGYKTCGAIKGDLEALFHEARTECQPANDKGRIALVFITPLPVLTILEAKRAWFIAIVAAVGQETRQAGLSRFSAIYMMDSETVKTLDAFSMPVARAADLQSKVKSGTIDSSSYVSSVMTEMRPAKLPKEFMQ